jgi:hypothetical protein
MATKGTLDLKVARVLEVSDLALGTDQRAVRPGSLDGTE